MREASEQQVVVLQAAIRQAGRTSHRLRLALAGGIALLLLVASFGAAGIAYRPHHDEASRSFLFWGSMLAVCLSMMVAIPGSWAYRQARGARLRRELAPLAPAHLAQVLTPLRGEPDEDTRQLAGSLLRALRVPLEVAPVEPPAGRGDEASAAADTDAGEPASQDTS